MSRDNPDSLISALTGARPLVTRPRAVWAVKLAAFCSLPLTLLLTAALAYQADQAYPVVGKFVVEKQTRLPEGLLVEGYMDKIRPCDFIGITGRDSDGNIDAVQFRDLHRPDSRPLGPQHWGPWLVQADPGEAVTFMVVHRCHALWPHYEMLGGFVAEGEKK